MGVKGCLELFRKFISFGDAILPLGYPAVYGTQSASIASVMSQSGGNMCFSVMCYRRIIDVTAVINVNKFNLP